LFSTFTRKREEAVSCEELLLDISIKLSNEIDIYLADATALALLMTPDISCPYPCQTF
jgi:hypothetical protein